MAALIFAGCATLPPAAEKEKSAVSLDSPKYLRYIVQKGDTLWKIGQMAYNDSSKWRKIFSANRDTIKDVASLTPGEIIIIPIE